MAKRTDQQRKSIELYCRLLGDALNDAGYSVLHVMKEGAEIPWSQALVKELLWREIQVAMKKDRSTTKLGRLEVSEVYEVLNRHLAEKFGVSVEFPSDELNRGR